MLLLPDSAVGTEEPDITKGDALKDGDLELELELDGDLEIPVDALDANPLEISALGDLVEATGEASPEANLLADNAAETVEIRYIDAKGKYQDEKTCIKVKSGDENRTLGPGWYAVTEDVHFEKDMIIQDAVNLILCDGTTLKVDDGI